MQKNRNVGIIGVGQSVYSSHREEVNQPEMIHEAVVEALANAGITCYAMSGNASACADRHMVASQLNRQAPT